MKSWTRGGVRIATVAILVLLAHVCQASPISYDEAVSGDLPDLFPSTVFALDVGANTLRGTTHVLVIVPVLTSVDFDQFAFTVPAGTHLTDIVYSFHLSAMPGLSTAQVNYTLD